ncbi:MAG: hypothetical protein ACK4UW_00575 [Rhizobium rhizophilum]|uniref:hypothetical protein n=1 Tax=Rhizobium rhizophilum TaxID=1850373 RepID=UPI00391CF24B
MIFIKFDENAFPEEVRNEARRLTEELSKIKDPAARSKFISSHGDFWRKQVRPVLMRLSSGKCWYSEARDVANVWHVDHFRPKGDVQNPDGSKRPGYWWLAFKLSNYRLAGEVMNTVRRDEEDGPLLGKWDKFPLCEGSYEALSADDDENLETSLLLDPCRDSDWSLITFDEYGRPVSNCDEGEFGHTRAIVSIELLHLDFEPLNEERRRVWQACEEKIKKASEIQLLPAKQYAYRKAELDLIHDNLREMISEEAELSSVARACLLHSPFKWANRFATAGAIPKPSAEAVAVAS